MLCLTTFSMFFFFWVRWVCIQQKRFCRRNETTNNQREEFWALPYMIFVLIAFAQLAFSEWIRQQLTTSNNLTSQVRAPLEALSVVRWSLTVNSIDWSILEEEPTLKDGIQSRPKTDSLNWSAQFFIPLLLLN